MRPKPLGGSSCADLLRSEETRSTSNPICWARWFSGIWTGWMTDQPGPGYPQSNHGRQECCHRSLQLLCQEVGCPYHEELRSTACSVALVVLWMGLHQEKFPLLATTLQAAAGVSGPQKWALILPSSARVSLVTYTAVIAVRYPELDNVQNDLICFGNYLLGEQATSGGFLPLFWDAPSAYMHALVPRLIGFKAKWTSALMRTVVLLSCTIETRWSPPLATQSGSPNQTVRFSPRALHPVQA